jgi:ABC-type uncharacterized transport system auxiliary subunit
VPDGDGRLEREVEDLQTRVRSLEQVNTPRQRELVEDLRKVREKVAELDTHGTAVTQVRLANIEEDLRAITKLFESEAKDKRNDRRAIAAALIAAAGAVAVAVIGWLASQGGVPT